MPHQYKRRTLDEAQELARTAFRAVVEDHLTELEIAELRAYGTRATKVPPGEGWEPLLGRLPEQHLFYEVELYRPSDQCPYIEKSFVRMLIPRNRAESQVLFIWRPVVPSYDGPYFE